jgi:hypothetical protein
MQGQTPDVHTQLFEAAEFWLTETEILHFCKQQGQ